LTAALRHGKQHVMLLWAGALLILGGVLCLAIDRRAAHYLYDNVHAPLHKLLDSITHAAKAAHWLVIAIIAYFVAQLAMSHGGAPVWQVVSDCAVAFLAALAGGSVVLHTLKFFLGRRRPRDEMEMNLYGFVPLSFDLQHNSFPSGHALTIFNVAVIASAAMPAWAALWFAIAIGLSATRALLTAHFLSDVLIGAGIGVVAAREAIVYIYPYLAPPWF
jgi:membrane-associated phospholipid phosphatase